jgi:predicted AAA+ superfamily ATPase
MNVNKKIVRRSLELNFDLGRSYFLFGPRKTGKSYWIKERLLSNSHQHLYINLLETDTFATYAQRPALLREIIAARTPEIVIIDEVQKLPPLLDEVHNEIEARKISFLLTGSSTRKIKRAGANLLAGRALQCEMCPLTFHEVEGFELERVMLSGLLPPHFLSNDVLPELRSYISLYLKEEIAIEAEARDLPQFADFLRVSAITNGELLNYSNVASESGIKTATVRNYFQILQDTLLGFRVPPWTKAKERRMIQTEKFYFFDVGVANYLSKRTPKIGGAEFGKSFEHFILMELNAYRAYENPELEIHFWRSASDLEIDFILGDKLAAIEVKGKKIVSSKDLKTLRNILDDGPIKHRIVVSLEDHPRKTADGILILPWQEFLARLWSGEFCA